MVDWKERWPREEKRPPFQKAGGNLCWEPISGCKRGKPFGGLKKTLRTWGPKAGETTGRDRERPWGIKTTHYRGQNDSLKEEGGRL